MNFLHKQFVKVGLLALALLAIILQAIKETHHVDKSLDFAARVHLNYDTEGKIPGNPENGVKQLKEIYKLIGVYRSRHHGLFPPDAMPLIADAMSNHSAYRFQSNSQLLDVFHNSDVQFSDSFKLMPGASPSSIIAYNITNTRYDGNTIGSSKPAGRRDVLAWTDIYQHKNSIRTREGGYERPVGFYLVLWDDGRVSRIPYYQVLLVPQANSNFAYAFPGQAGVPSTAVTYDKFYQSEGYKNGPRGS